MSHPGIKWDRVGEYRKWGRRRWRWRPQRCQDANNYAHSHTYICVCVCIYIVISFIYVCIWYRVTRAPLQAVVWAPTRIYIDIKYRTAMRKIESELGWVKGAKGWNERVRGREGNSEWVVTECISQWEPSFTRHVVTPVVPLTCHHFLYVLVFLLPLTGSQKIAG